MPSLISSQIQGDNFLIAFWSFSSTFRLIVMLQNPFEKIKFACNHDIRLSLIPLPRSSRMVYFTMSGRFDSPPSSHFSPFSIDLTWKASFSTDDPIILLLTLSQILKLGIPKTIRIIDSQTVRSTRQGLISSRTTTTETRTSHRVATKDTRCLRTTQTGLDADPEVVVVLVSGWTCAGEAADGVLASGVATRVAFALAFVLIFALV